MPYQNISATISAANLTAIKTKINEIKALLPFLINLTAEERQTIPKMGDDTLSFVSKALEYAQNNPNLVPPYVDIVEMNKDFKLAADLISILQPLNQLQEGVDDSNMAAGSEAFVTALAFYNTVKYAAKQNVPGAEAIYNDLKTRFPGGPQNGEPVITP